MTNTNDSTGSNGDKTVRNETREGVTFLLSEDHLGKDVIVEVYVEGRPQIRGEVRRTLQFGGTRTKVQVSTPSWRGDAADATQFASLITFLTMQAERLGSA